MRTVLISFVIIALGVLSGCAPTNAQATFNPLTGTFTGSLNQIPSTDPARYLTREVSPCGETRSIGVMQTSLPYYGRVLSPAIETGTRALRGEVSMSPRAFGLAVRESKDALRAEHAIEYHNAKVAMDFTPNRSMLSALIGKIFNWHRLPIPMHATILEASTPGPSVPFPQSPPPPGNTGGSGSIDIPTPTNPDGSFSIGKGLSSLENRVKALEVNQSLDHQKLMEVDAKIDQKFDLILAAVNEIKNRKP